MKKITLITGGARSGKSSFALDIALEYDKRGFIATAIPFDDEMKKRIKNHQAERENKFVTVEEPHNLAEAITELQDDVNVIIIDCISVWLGNLLFKHGETENKFDEVNKFYNQLNKINCDIIIVTNEVGMGIIPDNKLARNYREIAGFVNKQIAKFADEVILMISGIPLKIKELK